jgi:hypothetical protein
MEAQIDTYSAGMQQINIKLFLYMPDHMWGRWKLKDYLSLFGKSRTVEMKVFLCKFI